MANQLMGKIGIIEKKIHHIDNASTETSAFSKYPANTTKAKVYHTSKLHKCERNKHVPLKPLIIHFEVRNRLCAAIQSQHAFSCVLNLETDMHVYKYFLFNVIEETQVYKINDVDDGIDDPAATIKEDAAATDKGA